MKAKRVAVCVHVNCKYAEENAELSYNARLKDIVILAYSCDKELLSRSYDF